MRSFLPILFQLGALFFPLTAIASLFGMNLAHGLSEHKVVIFWAVTAVSVALGFAMKSWVLAKRASESKSAETPPQKPS